MADASTVSAVSHVCGEELFQVFLDIVRRNRTGTLTITASDGRVANILWINGSITDVDTGRELPFLTEAIVDSGRIAPRKLRRAQKAAEKNGTCPGSELLEEGLLSEEEILEIVQSSLVDELTETLSREIDGVVFTDHEPTERLEDFRSELSVFLDSFADAEDTLLAVAENLDAWDLVEKYFDLMLDVYYATPSTFHYFREPEAHGTELRVLSVIDGSRDVTEVIRDSGLEPFEALRIVQQLVNSGEIELINPVQMFQLGSQLAGEGSLEKAAKLFRRAQERGYSNFDLHHRLAKVLDRLGRREEAAEHYLEYGTWCLSQLQVDEAIASLERVIQLSPEKTRAWEELFQVYLQQNRVDDALRTAFDLADLKARQGGPRAALDFLLPLRSHAPRETKLYEKIIELAETCRDAGLVREARQALASTFHEQRDAAQALEAYQKMFCEGNHSVEVRLKLAELHREQGNRRKAIDHINAILTAGGKNRVRDEDVLRSLHEAMRELSPADPRSNRWLVRHHLTGGNKEKGIELLYSWLRELERVGDSEEMATTLEHLIELEDSFENRWKLAMVLEKLGRAEQSRRELLSLANLATRRKEFDQAARALDHILAKAPLDLQTRKAQVELLEVRGETRQATEKLKELSTLEILAGNVQQAEEHCRRFLVLRADDGEIVYKLGKLCLACGDLRKAEEQFLKAAKIYREGKNFGLARVAIYRLLGACPGHQEGTTLLKQIEEETRSPRMDVHPSAPVPPPTTAALTPSATTKRREPFQQGMAVKTTVAGITARLRHVKLGQPAQNDPPAPADDEKESSSGDAAPAPAPAPDAPPAEAPPEGGGAKRAAGGLKSAVARLRAIAEQKPAKGAAPAPAADSPPSQEPQTTASDTVRPAEASSPSPVPGAPSPEVVLPKRLNTSASRLAALRKAAREK